MIPGLVSITFRKKTPEQILTLCEQNGLRAIEWGGDVHVPPDNPAWAAKLGHMTRERGIRVCSYGSYYRMNGDMEAFARNLEAAAQLGAPVMRVWAGAKGSLEHSADERAVLVERLNDCAGRAKEAGVALALEYHGGTLTDRRDSVRQLMTETRTAGDSLRFYWQPRWDWPEDERLDSLNEVLPRIAHLHVFTWTHPGGQIVRLPLSEGEAMWREALERAGGEDRCALLEFVENDEDAALARDARVLCGWCR